MYVYADNAATTPVSSRAKEAMLPCLETIYGNPSSLHQAGQAAAAELKKAREIIARYLGAQPNEIYFTSGGSEADNQAIRTAAWLGARKGKRHLISTKIEHHAVLHTLEKLQKEGFTVTLLDVDSKGLVTPEQVEAAIQPDTALVTIMYANNEIGTIEPIEDIALICQKHQVLFHTDAVQAAGHLAIDVKKQPIDLLSLSAHKFHGPKGVGVLYCRQGIPLQNVIEGGGQERGKRGGTENVAGIAGMAAAFAEACETMEFHQKKVTALRDRLIDGLLQIPHSRLNGDRNKRLPGNVSLCFEGIEGESLLLLLDAQGIAGSSGSACTSGSLDPSHVLMALGLPHEIAHGSLRLSLSAYNTMEEVEYMLKVIPEVVAKLRDISPVWERIVKGGNSNAV